MSIPLFANRARSTLASGITAGATSLTLDTGDGSKFPSPIAGQYGVLVLVDTATDVYEVITYTLRTGDTISSITRGVEGTNQAWNAGDLVVSTITEGELEKMSNSVRCPESDTCDLIVNGTVEMAVGATAVDVKSNKVTNVGAPTTDGDAVRWEQVKKRREIIEFPDNGTGGQTRYNLTAGRDLVIGEFVLGGVAVPYGVDETADIDVYVKLSNKGHNETGKKIKLKVELQETRTSTHVASSLAYTASSEVAMPDSDPGEAWAHLVTITDNINTDVISFSVKIEREASSADPTAFEPIVCSGSIVEYTMKGQ